ncbi:MAG: hypothetical protein LBI42_02400 [Chitinispirillales bacterium]|jgi:hypothetical protein|nr:hypothetical protein [Chitinispirillales bacterium]
MNFDYNIECKGIIDDFFKKIHFSHQARREIAEWVPEIAYREKSDVRNILEKESIQMILSSEKLNAPQKAEKIRDELYKMRFPLFSDMQKRWKKAVNAANPSPSKVQFIPSPGFEKKRLEIRVTVGNADEARKIFASLAEMENDKWDEIIFPKE